MDDTEAASSFKLSKPRAKAPIQVFLETHIIFLMRIDLSSQRTTSLQEVSTIERRVRA